VNIVISSFNFHLANSHRTYRAEIHTDDDAPWDNCDTLGSVTDWETRSKHPGERILCSDRRYHRLYDFAAAIRKGRQEGMSGEQAAKQAEQEYRWIKAWCNDNWHYVGVVVFPLTDDGDELKSKSASLWSVEDNDDKYLREVAEELAHQCRE